MTSVFLRGRRHVTRVNKATNKTKRSLNSDGFSSPGTAVDATMASKQRCVSERQTTWLRKPISVEKRVAVGLYRLCSSAEDRTIARLFGIGRSTVNVLYREFCKAVISQREREWLHMIRQEDMKEHLGEFFAFSGFPQGIGALD
ncbi:hypothetical protein HPB52_024039 [Rhipicephalus sanguineus]|uniref:Uncharacterized protein n=1 Tax=Rhipicephalus sanguineus TaxID=34632 RepID=A0A9D4SZU2_RHISA|nr:hypothetical protein HPB52_024039 [Rhipicephalus sanguineus]